MLVIDQGSRSSSLAALLLAMALYEDQKELQPFPLAKKQRQIYVHVYLLSQPVTYVNVYILDTRPVQQRHTRPCFWQEKTCCVG
ncbi:hypothetical protein METBIDRAFT_116843 [Metschnikowia bicuspidata var. bicuspidata NRRL YB-4993]|uniref:Uncharacterized protein n=1 Tax=Metschnikowia bicuspidata var. bicuspidata NRRL YB-4993 TaxID=869754 RepID=A0A1A0HIR5_9ASCO|nr:hypothetical protein METBIDRAFT_116843 [Metschnikowia bicuspidata var. bicuspidata NRRL YB-4993]OBA24049.1 hypothetical protein METBIDRAFT_116843 [Metschnikowia bicuspidata var. bicuspidata NRRL YB-4993]